MSRLRPEEYESKARYLLETSQNHTDSSVPADQRIATHTALQAIGYALVALVPLVKEIGDQLDTLPQRRGTS